MENWLRWDDGTPLSLQQLHQLTGLSIQKESMLRRLRRARASGYAVSTLQQQISQLSARRVTEIDDLHEIPFEADADEARRLKTVREALLLDEKRRQAEIVTRLQRKEVFYLESLTPAWASMVIGVREALLGAVGLIVDKVMPCDERDEAVERAEKEITRHLNRISAFDLVRELDEQTGEETWEFTETDLE